ncbi:MAG: hypothetical protein ACOYL6_13715 [Bacteriovoracaceae bacterium]
MKILMILILTTYSVLALATPHKDCQIQSLIKNPKFLNAVEEKAILEIEKGLKKSGLILEERENFQAAEGFLSKKAEAYTVQGEAILLSYSFQSQDFVSTNIFDSNGQELDYCLVKSSNTATSSHNLFITNEKKQKLWADQLNLEIMFK